MVAAGMDYPSRCYFSIAWRRISTKTWQWRHCSTDSFLGAAIFQLRGVESVLRFARSGIVVLILFQPLLYFNHEE